ncbi:MAG TPA: hypothetical protein VM052_08375, partial [Candidatus Limnocylindrales bacterium]|nr:hypothetical protein [Candidatus Limnocylindrales bacterium]
MRWWVRAAALAGFFALAPAQAAFAQAPGTTLGETGFRDRVGNDLVDRLDIIWIEQGHVFFSFGNGKLFGIDVRSAMGNPAAMRTTTEVKWENFLATFNSHIVLLASRYPAQLYGEQGVVVNEREIFTNRVTRPFNEFATEEYIDLTGYLLTTS